MRKRQSKLSDERLHDIWNVRGLDYGERELEDFDVLISSAVSRCLKEDQSDRGEQAATLSYLLGEEVSVATLDSYTSEARRDRKIPASRLFALIAMTRRFDILDAVLREVGGKALDRHDAKVFRVGVDYIANLNAARHLRDSVAEWYPALEPEV
jgi:hypothetical protein